MYWNGAWPNGPAISTRPTSSLHWRCRTGAPGEAYDPNKLVRFLLRHVANGVAGGWTFMLALIWLDVGGIGGLIRGSDQRELVTAMMAGAFGVTFGLVGLVYGVLVVLPGEE